MFSATAVLPLLLLILAAPSPTTQGQITSMEVRFFKPEAAGFGPNVLKNGAFSGWNDFMLDGNGGYGRGDAVVVVNVSMPERSGRNFVIDGPLTITAQNEGKTLARRTFRGIDVPPSGKTSRAVYLQDIGCTGRINISAKLGGQTEAVRLDMGCGE